MATIFAYPSVFEGFGIPILEALNCEVPVITSTGSCFSEAGGPGSRYVAPGDINGLANAIQELSQNKTLRQEMKKLGLEHALKFRPEITVTLLEVLYKKVLAE